MILSRYLEALRGLRDPRRLGALVIVSGALGVTEWIATRSLEALVIDGALVALFVTLAPGGYRVLSPRLPAGLASYGLLGVLSVALVAWLAPRWTYVIDPGSLLLLLVLFLVGGWGLGRDLELSERAERLTLEAERARVAADRQAVAAERSAVLAERSALLAQQNALLAQRSTILAQQNALLAQRAQLDPHFLFNVLNAIAEHTRRDPAVAEEALLELASLLRTMLEATSAPSWPLATELELVRAVTKLYVVRDRRRYRFALSCPALDDVTVPPLLLLPVIENAITHGPGADHDGEVRLEVRRAGDEVIVEVSNPGVFDGPRPGGRGLAMIRERLAIAYGERARFTLEVRDGSTLARLTLPVAGATEVA